MINHFIFIVIWVVEVLLAIVLIVSLLIGKVIYQIKERKDKKVEERLGQLLFLLMTHQKKIEDIDWDKEMIPRAILLTILETYHSNFHDEKWDEVEDFLTSRYLLPWARTHTHKKRWIMRNQVARTFLLRPEKADFESILQLLNDKSFFIRMVAAEALGELRTKEAIEPLLRRMSKEPGSCRFIYRFVLLKTSAEQSDEIIRIYSEASDDEQLRLCCLDILSYRYYGNIFELIAKDFDSSNSSIRWRIIKILGCIATEQSTEKLVYYLADADPRNRQEALKALGVIQSQKTFAKVTPLIHDPIYEVRLEAAQTIAQFKKIGREFLERQDWDIDPLAHEVARFVLTS